MTQGQAPGNKGGLFRRLLRLILNKSGKDYLTSMTGGDAYWDRMLAAQRRVQEQPAGPGTDGPARRHTMTAARSSDPLPEEVL